MSTIQSTKTVTNSGKQVDVRKLTATAMLSAVAFVLMMFDLALPIMPSFIKLDISELPALLAAFAFGPVSGVLVCLIKNILHLLITTTGGVGEISNFILGAAFVLPAGLIYKHKKSKTSAFVGALIGAAVMAVISFPSNYFVVYPFYYNFMPQEAIVSAYSLIASEIFHYDGITSIAQCLLFFNVPFTFVKGLISVFITMLIYKPLRPVLKGRN